MSKKLIFGSILCTLMTPNAFATEAIPADRLVTGEYTYNAGSCGTSDIEDWYYCGSYQRKGARKTESLEANATAEACSRKGFPNYRIVSSTTSLETTVWSLGTDVVTRRKTTAQCLTAAEAQAQREVQARIEEAKQKIRQEQAQEAAQAELNQALRATIANRTETGCEFRFELEASQEGFLNKLHAITNPRLTVNRDQTSGELLKSFRACADLASVDRGTTRITPVQRLALASFDSVKESRAVTTGALSWIVSGTTMAEMLNVIVAVQNPGSDEERNLLSAPGADTLVARARTLDGYAQGMAIRNILLVLGARTMYAPKCAAKAQEVLTALDKVVLPADMDANSKADVEASLPDLRFQFAQYLSTPCQEEFRRSGHATSPSTACSSVPRAGLAAPSEVGFRLSFLCFLFQVRRCADGR